MRLTSVFESGAFRFALLLATVFAIGSLLLLVVVERSVSDYALEATAGSLRGEVSVLASEQRHSGRTQLLAEIARHARAQAESPFHYLLVDRQGRRLAGDLSMNAARSGWATVTFNDPGKPGDEPETDVLKSLGTRLEDGSLLVVATDTFDIQQLRRGLDWFVALAGLGITLFVLIGGYFVGALFMRRLDLVNATVGRIMAGNLSERLPRIGMSPEFDDLSHNLNRMLDRIGSLMADVRQVSTDIAHDLRTPLTNLRHNLESVQGANSAAIYDAAIEDALARTDDLLDIFRALLLLGTLEGSVARARFVAVDLGEIAGRVQLAYAPSAEDQGKTLTGNVEAAVVLGDADLLTRLFTNLIENALAHTPPTTHISIDLHAGEGVAVVVVADNGPGIPEHERRNVFNRFYRLESSRNTPGAGLGLSLVAAIATLHDAQVRIADNAPGVRVMLTFRLMERTAT